MKGFYLVVIVLIAGASAQEEIKVSKGQNDTNLARNKKALSVFQVVRFPNSVCTSTSSSYNGTCYTSSECLNKGGSSAGTCASGFGVCCLFVLACGGSAAQNCSYLVQSSTTSLTSPCTYTICKCNTNICRIRLDFTSFQIAEPVTVSTADAPTTTTGTAIGDCVTDAFSLTSPGNDGSPTICGFNTGQHMIVDASDKCHKASFTIGASTTTTRSWSIKVTQYACGSEFLGGPPDCLQYFTGTTGVISSFNYPTTTTSVPFTTTHLSNQCYTMCIRREQSYCYICYSPELSNIQDSFGLSVSPNTAALSAIDSLCTTDYITIPGGQSTANIPAAISFTMSTTNRYCGRYLSSDVNAIAGATVCTRYTPFRISFKTNADEVTGAPGANMANGNEESEAPLGVLGFSLRYWQVAC